MDSNLAPVTLIVTDKDGNTCSQSLYVIFPVAKVLSITPAEPNEGDPVTITVGVNDGFTIQSVAWVIDGTTINDGASITQTFTDHGQHTFTAAITTT